MSEKQMAKQLDPSLTVNVQARSTTSDPMQARLQPLELCTFKGARRLVLNRVWSDANKLQDAGIALDNAAFGYLIKRAWTQIKREQSTSCPVLSPQQIEQVLSRA